MLIPILFVLLNFGIEYSQGFQKCNFGPSRLRPETCCKILPAYTRTELMTECKVGDMYGENHSETPACEPFNCIMQKSGFLGTDFKINRQSVRSTIYSQYPNEWSLVVETALNNCFTQLDSGSICESRTFAFCFMHYMLLNCPQTYWTLSNNCDNTKLFLQNCLPPAM